MPADRAPHPRFGKQTTIRHHDGSISFIQRPLLRPWRVEKVRQKWDGQCWVVVARSRVRRGRFDGIKVTS